MGIPTTEDKALKRAVTMLLEPICEEEFYDFSFGFLLGIQLQCFFPAHIVKITPSRIFSDITSAGKACTQDGNTFINAAS
jgi:retron-type reverse transcriptase